MPISFPAAWVAKEKVKPSKLNAFFSAITSKFAAGITSADLASNAGVKGSQISNAGGTRITNANLEDDCVDSRALATDATPGAPSAPIQDGTYVKDGALPGTKLTNNTTGLDKLEVTVHEVAFSGTTSGVLNFLSAAANPTLTFDQATYELIGLMVRTLTGTAVGVVCAPITGNGGGANWQGAVNCHASAGGTISGVLRYIFIKKVS